MTGSWFTYGWRASFWCRWSFKDNWSWSISYPISQFSTTTDERHVAERLRKYQSCLLIQGITSSQCTEYQSNNVSMCHCQLFRSTVEKVATEHYGIHCWLDMWMCVTHAVLGSN